MSAPTSSLFRSAILVVAPATLLAGGIYHPWIGSPGNTGFLPGLATAVADGPNRWAVAHLLVATGSGLLMLAFLALHDHLREQGVGRWSLRGIPFIVIGSTLYALLPAMEFAPLAAAEAGADAVAAQAALFTWFRPTLVVAAFLFAVGIVSFAISITRSGVLGAGSKTLVVGALVVMAAARFVPVGAAQLYIAPAAGTLALWILAYAVSRRPQRAAAKHSIPAA